MSVTDVLSVESRLFVYGLGLLLAMKLLTGRINLHGLLVDKAKPQNVSAERVQLLIVTIAVVTQFIRASASGGSGPRLEPGWFYLFGGSTLVYTARKVLERYKS